MPTSFTAHLQAGVRAHHRHIQTGVADEGAHLLAGTHGGKHRKGGHKHLVAAAGKAHCAAHEILLGNAEGKFTPGVFFAEMLNAAGLGVGAAHHKIGVFRAQLHQALAKCHSCCQSTHYSPSSA